MAEPRRSNAGDDAQPPAEAPVPASAEAPVPASAEAPVQVPEHRPFPRWLLAVWIVFAAWAAWYLLTNLKRG
jgi:hypothetical protein